MARPAQGVERRLRTTSRPYDEKRETTVLLALVFALAALGVAYLMRLGQIVRADRPARPPRSHLHELDPFAMRLEGWTR